MVLVNPLGMGEKHEGDMTQALVALIFSLLEILELWTGWNPPGITEQWIETLLMVLAPIGVWIVGREWWIKRFE